MHREIHIIAKVFVFIVFSSVFVSTKLQSNHIFLLHSCLQVYCLDYLVCVLAEQRSLMIFEGEMAGWPPE